jgi:hypothetical protein
MLNPVLPVLPPNRLNIAGAILCIRLCSGVTATRATVRANRLHVGGIPFARVATPYVLRTDYRTYVSRLLR